MRTTIDVELSTQAVGSVARVKQLRLFRSPVITEFTCVSANPISGGVWVNKATGKYADHSMCGQLNVAARAKVMIGALQ
jgi:hypothetical protein